jgi:GT2 family glycosyltransferase
LKLLECFNRSKLDNCKIIIRNNVHSDTNYKIFPELDILSITNDYPMGFGCNHNLNFKIYKSEFFLVINPDVYFLDFDLSSFYQYFNDNKSCKLLSPFVFENNLQIKYYNYPSIISLFLTIFKKKELCVNKDHDNLKWIPGLFMFFDSNTFRDLDGFDTRFYMYLEDVDICKRLCDSGCEIKLLDSLQIFHNAHRSSHKSIKFFFWHLSSYLKFILKI